MRDALGGPPETTPLRTQALVIGTVIFVASYVALSALPKNTGLVVPPLAGVLCAAVVTARLQDRLAGAGPLTWTGCTIPAFVWGSSAFFLVPLRHVFQKGVSDGLFLEFLVVPLGVFAVGVLLFQVAWLWRMAMSPTKRTIRDREGS